jgi:hypothetical protein
LSGGSDNGLVDGGNQGADGVAFVLQNGLPVATGEPGDGIGYNGIPSGLAVEFDAYLNPAFSDPSPAHVAVQVGDGRILRPWHVPPFLRGITAEDVPQYVANGQIYCARIVLEGKRLSVYSDSTGLFVKPCLVVDEIDLAEILDLTSDGSTFMGITAATGLSQQQHELLELAFGSCERTLVSVRDEGAEESNRFEARVVPFPTWGQARVEFDAPLATNMRCQITDTRGSEVATVSIAQGSMSYPLPVTNLVPGLYRVQLVLPDQLISLPLMVLR